MKRLSLLLLPLSLFAQERIVDRGLTPEQIEQREIVNQRFLQRMDARKELKTFDSNALLNPVLTRAAERRVMGAPDLVASRTHLPDGQTVTVFKDGVVTTNRLPRMFTNRVELSPRAKVLKAAVEMAEAQGADPTDDLDVANKLMAARTLVTQLTAEIRKAEPDLGLVEMLVRDLGADTPVKPIQTSDIVGPGKEIGR